MKNNYTHISLVLDRSGSMATIKSGTIEGVNKFIHEQREVPGEATFTLVLFDHEYSVVHDFKSIKDVSYLNNETFVPRGSTSLRDAIGKTIKDVGAKLAALSEYNRPSKVLVAIMTDGEENTSREFSMKQINDMITHQTNVYDWDFLFLGANQDAIATAQSYSIPTGNAMNYTASNEGIQKMSSTLSCNSSSYRSGNLSKGKFFDQNDQNTNSQTTTP